MSTRSRISADSDIPWIKTGIELGKIKGRVEGLKVEVSKKTSSLKGKYLLTLDLSQREFNTSF